MTLAVSPLLADFSYQQTSTITGGLMASLMKVAGVFSKQAREPIRSTIAVKGDRMVHCSATSASVIDLASQTITHIDLQISRGLAEWPRLLPPVAATGSPKRRSGNGQLGGPAGVWNGSECWDVSQIRSLESSAGLREGPVPLTGVNPPVDRPVVLPHGIV